MTRFEFTQWCPCCQQTTTVLWSRDQAQAAAEHLQAQLAELPETRFAGAFMPKTAPAGAAN